MAHNDDPSVEPPLWRAVKADDTAKVAELLESRVDPNEQASKYFGWTALHVAAGHGCLQAAETLLIARASISARASDGETPLHLAASQGEDAAIRYLIEKGAEVDVKNDDGETALHVAVQHIGSKEPTHIHTLIELRANPAVQDNAGQDAHSHANIMTNRGHELAVALGQKPDDAPAKADRGTELTGALLKMCRRGSADAIRQLLKWMPDQAAAAKRALVSAAAGGNIEAVETLVAARADVRTTELDELSGMTPLIAAADEGAVKMVKWLLSQQADATLASREGATALMAAAMQGSAESVSAILTARADPDQQAHSGWTALMAAGQSGRLEVARCLLDAKARIDLSQADGATTARSLAAANSHDELVKLFETRTKLNVRRAKAAAQEKSGGGVEDTRDLDALLADLGEPQKKAGRAKKAGKAISVPADAAPVNAPAATADLAVEPAPSCDATGGTATKPTTGRTGKKAKGAHAAQAAQAKALRDRLGELARMKAEIEAEEVRIRQQLTQLGDSENL